jgi:hypothetical protein
MTDSDQDDFAAVLAAVLGFYGQTATRFVVDVWWQACRGFELGQVRKALSAHAVDPDRGQWAPKPADLVRQLNGTQADRSLIAWGKVSDAMASCGAYRSVVFDDSAIHAAVQDMGGWPTVCRTTIDELPFTMRRFSELHRTYSARGCEEYPPRLIGEHEAANRAEGRSVTAPHYIGDVRKALEVERSGSLAGKTAITTAGAALRMLAHGAPPGPLDDR